MGRDDEMAASPKPRLFDAKRSLAMVVASLALISFVAACTKPNPIYCEDNSQCANGTTCDVQARTCVANADGALDTVEGCTLNLGSGAYAICLQQPLVTVTLTGTVDTDFSNLCLHPQPAGWSAAGQPDSCFIVGTSMTVVSVNVSGSRPLVLASASTLEMTGTLDVASHVLGPKTGPGIPAPSCSPFVALPTNDSSGGGGGAGASFMGVGRNGGFGNNGFMNTGGTAPASDALPPAVLRAGCSGQKGGNGAVGTNTGAPGGGGGGGVYVVARDSISITGIINASGAGAGRPATQAAGGGGGGSGGMIVLFAPAITGSSNGRLVANGGGGSSGADSTGGTNGNDPPPANPDVKAATAVGPVGTGMGGAGATGTIPAQLGGDGGTGLGGGGGGGSVGYIQSNLTIDNIVVSPAITVIP